MVIHFVKRTSCYNSTAFPFIGIAAAILQKNQYHFYRVKAGKVVALRVQSEGEVIEIDNDEAAISNSLQRNHHLPLLQ